MCEASSTPLHDEGIIGDAITFLLTTNYVADESDQKFKKYFAAQAKGKVQNIWVKKHWSHNNDMTWDVKTTSLVPFPLFSACSDTAENWLGTQYKHLLSHHGYAGISD